MKPTRLPDVKRGPMTGEEKAEIERLARLSTDPKPGRIAAKLNRHPATVNWYMLRHGLIERTPGYISGSYSVNGVARTPWSPEQDRRLEEVLVSSQAPSDAARYREAAAVLSKEFGISRKAHSCQVRAVMLAASPEPQPELPDWRR